MKYISFFTAITATLVMVGCGSSDNETQATPPVSTEASTQPTTTNTAPGTVTAPTINTTPAATTTAQPTASTNAALNPEHGKPGHRCDIAVGAPLDSKPIQATIQQPATTPANVSAPVVTQSSPTTMGTKTTPNTGAGLNPEHGKPGHRCDIAVGAPLDSKPIQTTIQQPTTTTAPKAALPYTPVNNQPTTAVAKGMNPAHGQPGHRCDIAVGAPLDSKPAQPAAVVAQPSTTNGAKKELKVATQLTDIDALKPKN